MACQRIALAIAYDGTSYHGWQIQEGVSTIQQQVEYALSCVANHPVRVICSGRTDVGVHATGQVLHFDTTAQRSSYSWCAGANSHLAPDISILWAKKVPSSFHARFSATARSYWYFLYNSKSRPAILNRFVGWDWRPLDHKRMAIGAGYLLGTHDFSAFRGSYCQAKTPIRTLSVCTVNRREDLLIIKVKANAFLLHMVRRIIGALLEVGAGNQPPEWIALVLRSCNRAHRGVTVDPSGLYFVSVDYPSDFMLPKTNKGPFFFN